MKKRLSLMLLGLMVTFVAMAQTVINGTVVDATNGEPLPGASIKIKGTKKGTVADVNGKFKLDVAAGKTLIFSYIGMGNAEHPAKDGMRVELSSLKELDELLVVAYGTTTKSQFTGSASVMDAEELQKSQVTSVTNALAGAVPGVQLSSSNGAPGATSTIRIRGFSSITAGSEPLIIVDGAPYSGDMSNLNPNDVESMTVLKDASSAALYGARGANGVIIITTKKAKRGDAVVTFDAKWGSNSRALSQYDVVTDPAQYYEMHYGAVKNYWVSQGMSEEGAWLKTNTNLFGPSGNGGVGYNVYTIPEGQMLIGRNGKLNPNATLGRVVSYNGEDYLLTPDDWQEVGTRNGLRQEYNFSVAAAGEKSNFYTSLGYLDNQGITEGSDLKRLTARLKADYQVKKWMKVGANMAYTRFDGNTLKNNGSSASTGNIWAFTQQMAPIYPAYIRNADGSIKVDKNGYDIMDYGDGKNAGSVRPMIGDANPIQDNRLNTTNYEGNAMNGNGFVTFTPLEGLSITLNGTVNLDETRGTYYYNPYYGQFNTTGGTLQKYHQRAYDYDLQQLINYNTTIAGVHNLDVMLGHTYSDVRGYYLSASKSNMFSPDNLELGGAIIDGQSAYSEKTRYNNEGYMGRVLYNYDNKYFASGSYRRDASSRFHPDHRWGNFWSIGGAWLMNKEKWFDVKWIDELKVKASYGMQGNDNISNFRYTDVYEIKPSDGNIGSEFVSKGTEDITWETNANINAGIEFSLFNNKLTGSMEYYRRNTTDMLYSFSVSPSLGYSSYMDNVGDMYNTGFELDLKANIFNTKNFKWDVTFNLTTLKNEITMLHDDKKTSTRYTADGEAYHGYNSGNFFIAEGTSIYSWTFKDYAGVYSEDTWQQTADAAYDPSKAGLSMWYKTVYDEQGNFDHRITTTTNSEADYYISGGTTLPDVFGGIGTSIQFYDFDFSINCSYQIGGQQYDGTYQSFMSSPTGTNTGHNFHVDLLNSWSATNTSTDIPRFQYNDTYSAASSSRFLTSASYFNINNINLGYTVPTKWIKKLGISSLRLYAAAENVAYWSARKGFDPRQSWSSTTNATTYSPMRTISGGITLKF